MQAPGEHRSGQDLEQLLRVETSLARQSEDFAQNLQAGRAHGVSGKLDEIRHGGVIPDSEDLLTERIEDRLAAIEIGRRTSRDDKQLTSLGGIRISEDGRCNVASPIPRVLARKP